MSMDEPLTDASMAERERLNRCRDEVERAEAHLLAAQAPEAWVATGLDGAELDGVGAASAYSLEAGVAEELLRPLDAEVRGRIADDVLGSYLAEIGDDARVTPIPTVVAAANGAGRGRRWWPLPMTAAAAVLLTLFYVDLRGSAGAPADAFEGRVLLSPKVRAGSERGEPAATMRIRGGDHFTMYCQAEGRTVTIIGARAELSGVGTVRKPSSETVDVDGSVLNVLADLEPGTWKVTCDSFEPSSGRLSLVGPAATLIVE